jgi:putative oxidoreductase
MSLATYSYLGPIGRLLVVSPFLIAGPGKIMAPMATAAFIASGGLPESPALAIATGVFEVLAGLALLVGYKARWAALALAAFTLLASLLFHKYWAAPVEQQFVQQLLFSKNIAIVGALLFIAATGAGPWSAEPRAGLAPVGRPATRSE